jgi:hypothetical protein
METLLAHRGGYHLRGSAELVRALDSVGHGPGTSIPRAPHRTLRREWLDRHSSCCSIGEFQPTRAAKIDDQD